MRSAGAAGEKWARAGPRVACGSRLEQVFGSARRAAAPYRTGATSCARPPPSAAAGTRGYSSRAAVGVVVEGVGADVHVHAHVRYGAAGGGRGRCATNQSTGKRFFARYVEIRFIQVLYSVWSTGVRASPSGAVKVVEC